MDKLAGLLFILFLTVSTYTFLSGVNADAYDHKLRPAWYITAIFTFLTVLPVFQHLSKIPPDNPIFNFLVAFGISNIVTPLLFGKLKFGIWQSIGDLLFVSVSRILFAGLFAWVFTFTHYKDWFAALFALSLLLFASRFGLYRNQAGAGRHLLRTSASALILFFIYYSMIEYSTITIKTWYKAFDFIIN
jgi:hypothetical protein